MKRVSIRSTTLAPAFARKVVAIAKASPKLKVIACLPAALLFLGAQASLAGSATWSLNPGSGDWNTATNWTPATVPNGPGDTATFALSNITGVSDSLNAEVNGIVFNAGASAFTITASPTFTLTISGVGITNNSGIMQNFVGAVHGAIIFTNSSTAGSLTAFTNDGGSGGGGMAFVDNSTAGNGTFTNNGGTVGGASGGMVGFLDNSTAGNGTFINNGGTVSGAFGGQTQFGNTPQVVGPTAGNGTFINNGSTVSGGGGGLTDFQNTSTAGNATLIANGGLGGGNGGLIQFYTDSTGGTARVEVFGNGTLDISPNNAPGVTIGSIEGSGVVFLGPKNLTVGSNNLNTTFSGVIQAGGANASFTKVGAGILTFEGGANNDHIADAVTLSIVSGSTVNLNFSGSADTIGGLIVDGVAQPAGLYGSPASGAPNQLSVFAGTGFVLVGPPVIISVTSATGRTGSPFNFQVATTGGTSAERLSATGLPPGLTADPLTGKISGTPTSDGTFLVTLTVTEAGLTNTATLELTFTSDLAVPVIVSPNSALLFPGLPFSYTIVAPTSDLTDPVTYTEIGPLPPGLGLDQTTGIISGTPLVGRGLLPTPSLAGGVVTNVQIFACNSSGCAAQGLFFVLPTGAVNISTRLSVGTDANLLIGGFIIQGNAPMKLVLRAIGPSLTQFGVTGALADPSLELHDSTGTAIGTNDNWMANLDPAQPPDQAGAILATGLAPTDNLESAILGVLDPGGYTAITSGKNDSTGVGLVEVYDLAIASLDVSSEAYLGNISTRGNVQTDANVMIGGFINKGAKPIQVLVRGIGPSLTPFGVSGALANPTLELHHTDDAGKDVVLATNDDWMSDQKAMITATGLTPTDPLESAILITLPVGQGSYTAVVKGANATTGVGLVEAYFGNPCLGTSCP